MSLKKVKVMSKLEGINFQYQIQCQHEEMLVPNSYFRGSSKWHKQTRNIQRTQSIVPDIFEISHDVKLFSRLRGRKDASGYQQHAISFCFECLPKLLSLNQLTLLHNLKFPFFIVQLSDFIMLVTSLLQHRPS